MKLNGWVLSDDSPHRSLGLEICCDGIVVEELAASVLRNDIQGLRCGFSCMLPEAFLDGESHILLVRIKGSNIILRNCPYFISPKKIQDILWNRTNKIMASGMQQITKMQETGFLPRAK